MLEFFCSIFSNSTTISLNQSFCLNIKWAIWKMHIITNLFHSCASDIFTNTTVVVSCQNIVFCLDSSPKVYLFFILPKFCLDIKCLLNFSPFCWMIYYISWLTKKGTTGENDLCISDYFLILLLLLLLLLLLIIIIITIIIITYYYYYYYYYFH